MKSMETKPLTSVDPCQAVIDMGQVIQGTLGRDSTGTLRRYVPANVQEDGSLKPDEKAPAIYLRESRFAQWRSVLVSSVVIVILLYLGTKTNQDVSNLATSLRTGLKLIIPSQDVEVFNNTSFEA